MLRSWPLSDSFIRVGELMCGARKLLGLEKLTLRVSYLLNI